jgi:uncharacterized protein (TIGR02680 family)
MTTTQEADAAVDEDLQQTPAKHHPNRWRLHRGGIVNCWFYYDEEFAFSGGRAIWRGTNGAGKSRALEMLLPYLFDADRRNIDATGAQKVRLEELMRAGADDAPNRVGYLWLELAGTDDNDEPEFLTVGAHIRFSRATASAKAWFFTTPLRVGDQLTLMDSQRLPLSRDALAELIGPERISESPEAHRERVRSQVFGLTGESGRERFTGLLQLLHVLRNPDVGHRIEAGALPVILSDALPPLSESALNSAGEQLDGLSETRAAQQRLEEADRLVSAFLDTYRRYSAGVLDAGAERVRSATRTAREQAGQAETARDQHSALAAEHTAVKTDKARLEGDEDRLKGRIDGIKESKAYADARDLTEREKQLTALRRTVQTALHAAETARGVETDAVGQADGRADDVTDAASRAAELLTDARERLRSAGITAELLAGVSAEATPGIVQLDPVRTQLDRDRQTLPRPKPAQLAVTPPDPRQAATAVREVKASTEGRAQQATARHDTAAHLADELVRVEAAENRAGDAEQRSDEQNDAVRAAAGLRDDAAARLAVSWRGWTASPTTIALLGQVDWTLTPVAPLLADVAALTGDIDPDFEADADAELAQLDAAAERAAGAARQAVAARQAEISREHDILAGERADLLAEQQRLRDAQDPAPLTAPWHTSTPDGGLPLWQAVDFTDDIPDADRAGLEGALQAAGLLSAAVHPDGTLTARDGQVLISATGDAAGTPLAGALVPDPAASLPSALIAAVLTRVGFGRQPHPVWVAVDGSWTNGPLSGRHQPTVARHIGARARAAARQARLAQIDVELTALEEAGERLRALAVDVLAQLASLDRHLQDAPRTGDLRRARAKAAAAASQAVKAAEEARRLRNQAANQRSAWHREQQRHEEACAAFGLPTAAAQLAVVRQAAKDAARSCEQLAGRLGELAGRIERHQTALATAAARATRRQTEEEAADQHWATWQGADAEFAALKENVGRVAALVNADLRQAEEQLSDTQRDLRQARETDTRLAGDVSGAAVNARNLAERAETARVDLAGVIGELRRLFDLPGLTEAAIPDGQAAGITLPETDPLTLKFGAVERAAAAVSGALDRRGGTIDENTMATRLRNLELAMSGTFDVSATIVPGGVRLVALVDATGSRTVATAAADLARKVADGRSALTERERRVFTEFVLGGVADELRRRLSQAEALIRAMNTSLGNIRTSHGIGVKVHWALDVEPDSPLARIRSLVTTAGQVRTEAQNSELIELVKARVDEQFALDATAGYAAHLKAALDYRTWHEVEVIIVGPGAGQQRRISKRAKLSQGETRFVSYVTLFAAADAYLSGLPDTSRALRVILLDDAFAKVDNRTIGVLMGLLVRLDIDFAMTGHALWGCFPQVPALDVYEVRRREGSAAITTHVRWDGRVRHLRVAG